VANVVRANLLSARAPDEALGCAFNVALGGRTDLNELFTRLRDGLAELGVDCADVEAVREDFRPGDVRHSLADTTRAQQLLGYAPEIDFAEGIRRTLAWYVEKLAGDAR
jgi:UDP-N-acetylglucosamine 4-epimerase